MFLVGWFKVPNGFFAKDVNLQGWEDKTWTAEIIAFPSISFLPSPRDCSFPL